MAKSNLYDIVCAISMSIYVWSLRLITNPATPMPTSKYSLKHPNLPPHHNSINHLCNFDAYSFCPHFTTAIACRTIITTSWLCSLGRVSGDDPQEEEKEEDGACSIIAEEMPDLVSMDDALVRGVIVDEIVVWDWAISIESLSKGETLSSLPSGGIDSPIARDSDVKLMVDTLETVEE